MYFSSRDQFSQYICLHECVCWELRTKLIKLNMYVCQKRFTIFFIIRFRMPHFTYTHDTTTVANALLLHSKFNRESRSRQKPCINRISHEIPIRECRYKSEDNKSRTNDNTDDGILLMTRGDGLKSPKWLPRYSSRFPFFTANSHTCEKHFMYFLRPQ